MDTRAFLKKILDRYAIVSSASLDEMSKISEVVTYSKGTEILQIGAICKNKYILQKGIIVSSYLDEQGQEYHKNIFLENQFVASTVSAIRQTPSEFALKTIEDSVLVSLDYSRYRTLIFQRDDLKDFYIAYLEKNWVIDKEKRELDIILKDAHIRYKELLSLYPKIEQRVPLKLIASHLGITPTQLSRIRKNQ